MIDTRKIYHGDCLEILKQLPDESIDCCVTSPPYYGLRDYGTGTWVGGDPNCPHFRTSHVGHNTITGHKNFLEMHGVADSIYKTVCPRCGAIRVDKQIGLEETPEEYIKKLTEVFHEVKRVLKDDGTLWVNIGDSYWGSGSRGYDFEGKMSEASKLQQGSKGTISLQNIPKLTGNVNGYKNKDLIGIPWMLAFSLRADGWYLRQDIIWHKPNPMPESVKDRCTKSHEYIFLLSKSSHYYYDAESISEPITESTIKRLSQDLENQNGSYTPSKGNGNMKAVRSKYGNVEEEKTYRQGMNKDRGFGIVEKRYGLPTQEKFVSFIKSKTTPQQLEENTGIKRTTIDHWFRTDESGFAFPSVDDWNKIRDYVNDWTEEFQEMDNALSTVDYETDEIGKSSNGKRNKRDVWDVNVQPTKEAHFATFPERLIEPCILAGCREDGVVLDPFFGSGTTGRVAERLNRRWIGIELNPKYIDIAKKRTNNVQTQLLI